MARHFCFCIPVRVGVFILSFLTLITSGFLSVVLWYMLHEMDIKGDGFTSVTAHEKALTIVLGVIFTLIALSSLSGFLGAIAARRRFVKAYAFVSWLVFLATCASAGVLLYEVYSGKELGTSCVTIDEDGAISTGDCRTHVSTGLKVGITAIVIFELLCHLYLVSIIGRYVEQLEESEGWSGGEYKLTTTETTDTTQGLMNATVYPYTDAQNSYGNA